MGRRNFFGALTAGLAVALCGSFASELSAQEPATAEANDAPIAVVALSGVQPLSNSVVYLAEAAGQPGAGAFFAAIVGGQTEGIDPKRPIGLTVQLVDGAPSPLLFLPSSDISVFLKRLEAQLGPAEELEEAPDIKVIAAGATLLYIKQSGDWAFASQNRSALDNLPKDPTKLLGNLVETYDIGVRVNVQQIPADQRDLIVNALKTGFEQVMAQQSQAAGGPAADEESRRAAEQALEQLAAGIEETDMFMFGLAIEQDRGRVFFDLASTAVEGSENAKIADNTMAIPSKFASVIDPEAAMYYHAASSVSPEAVEQVRASITQSMGQLRSQLKNAEGLSTEQREELTVTLRRLFDMIGDTIEEGKFDIGFKVDTSSLPLKAYGGAFVADGAEVADFVKELAGKLQGLPDAPTFSFDEGEYKDTTLHTVTAKIDDPNAAKLLGETLTIKLGTAPNATYFALGDDAEATLKGLIDKAAIDTEAADRPLGQFYVSLVPILETVRAAAPLPVVDSILNALSGDENTSRVLLISRSIPRGQSVRLIIGEGIIRAAGQATKSMAPQGQPAGF